MYLVKAKVEVREKDASGEFVDWEIGQTGLISDSQYERIKSNPAAWEFIGNGKVNLPSYTTGSNNNGMVLKVGDKLLRSNRSKTGIIKLTPDVGTAALASDAASGNLLTGEISSAFPFTGVQLLLENWNTAAALTIDGIKLASETYVGNIAGYLGDAADSQSPTAASLSWSDFVTYRGAQTIVVPAATTGTSGDIIPGVVLTDYKQVSSYKRTYHVDTPYVVRYHAHIAAGTIASALASFNSVEFRAINSHADNPGFRVGTGNNINPLANLTTAGMPYGIYGGQCLSPSAVFHYTKPVIDIAVFGDSILAGAAAPYGYDGLAAQLNFSSFRNSQRFSVGNFAASGQKSSNSYLHLKKICAEILPTYALFKAWSPNDTNADQAYLDAYALIVDLIAWCKSYGIIPIIGTALPANGYTTSKIEALNDKIRLLSGQTIVVDFFKALTFNGQFVQEYTVDGTHLTIAGDKVLANLIRSSFVK